MSEQRTFAGLAWTAKTKVTRRERFLAEMNAVIPWAEFVAVIAPYYPTRHRHRSGRCQCSGDSP
jgi:IS5 family transposase